MIQTKEDLKRVIQTESKIYDKKWYFDLPFRISEKQELYKLFKLLRKTEYAYNSGHKILGRFRLFRLQRKQMKYGMAVPMNVLGEGFWITHLGSLIINEDSKIGKNFSGNPGICIGANFGHSPQIGDNVYMGPGAKVFGDVKIADGVSIGANAVVTKDCLVEGGLYVGIPAKLVESHHKREIENE